MFFDFLNKPKIKLINNNDKFEKVKLVKPHINFNRLDIKFNKDFELLEIQYKKQTKYISFHIDKKFNYAYLGLYMVDIDKKEFNTILEFIYKSFQIKKFYILQSKNNYSNVNKTIHSLLELPDSIELFDNRFSSKTRCTRRYKQKKMEKKYNCEFLYLNKENLTEKILDVFLELKRDGYKDAYTSYKGKDLLSDFFHITDTYILKIDREIAAIFFYSIIDKENVYFTNTTYNKKYSKFAVGELLYYASVKDLIKRGFKRIYLGGGEYDYKKNSKAIVTNTYQGFFTYIPTKDKWFSVVYYEKDGIISKYLYLLGIKIPVKKFKADYNFYLKMYKEKKIDKYINELAEEYKNKKIVIYGAGLMTKVLLENYDLSKLNICAVCDKKYEDSPNQTFYSYNCISPQDLLNSNYDVILVNVLWSYIVSLDLAEDTRNNKNLIIKPFINILY